MEKTAVRTIGQVNISLKDLMSEVNSPLGERKFWTFLISAYKYTLFLSLSNTHAHAHACTHTHVHTHVKTHTHTHTHTYTHTHMCIHTHTHTHTHVHTYTHTHTHPLYLSSLTCRQRDVDTFLQTSAQGLVNIPREVGGCQHHHCLGRVIVGHSNTCPVFHTCKYS